MKELLKELYKSNHRDFEVWNYLWLFADESESIEFSHTELCSRFNIPLSSLSRVLKIYPERWNKDKVLVEYEKVEYKAFKVTFYPKGKKTTSAPTQTIHDDLYDWLKGHYKQIDFDYADMPSHRKYVKTICDKLQKAMKERNTLVTDQSTKDTFQFFFTNIDSWWKDNGTITLPLISKHFTKILNQIKTSKNGKKRDSYSKAAEQIDGIDFGKLARN